MVLLNQPINQMVIKGDKASLTIDVAPTTTITIGKAKATLGDLKAIADASVLEEIKRSDLTIGLMVETPAIAEALDSYLEGIDFISIGSGDLSSYIIGAKRGSNEYERGLQTQRTRILDTINTITETAHRRHLDVTVCGVLGARPDYLKSLIDMTIDSISVPVSEVDNVDGVIRSREVVSSDAFSR